MNLQNCISVIVPVYNAEQYLAACVDSLLAQTYADFEVLLVDDGSADSSPAICDRYAAADDRVRVIHQKNAGVGAARNAGLDVARGAYLAFVDADDTVLPDYLETLYRDITEQDVDIVYCNCQEFYHGQPVNMSGRRVLENRRITDRNICYADMVGGRECYPICIWAALYRREQLRSLRFTSLPFGEDCVFNFDALTLAETVYLDTYAGYCYIRNDASATMAARKHDLRHCRADVMQTRYRFEHLPENVPQETRQRHFQYYAWCVHYFAYALALNKDSQQRAAYMPSVPEQLRFIRQVGLPLTGSLKLYIALLNRSFGLYAALVRVWQIKIRLTEGKQA